MLVIETNIFLDKCFFSSIFEDSLNLSRLCVIHPKLELAFRLVSWTSPSTAECASLWIAGSSKLKLLVIVKLVNDAHKVEVGLCRVLFVVGYQAFSDLIVEFIIELCSGNCADLSLRICLEI